MRHSDRQLVYSSIITITGLIFAAGANAATIATGGTMQLNEFSHPPQEVVKLQSAFGYFASEDQFVAVVSDPMFVTGMPFMLHPSAPKAPAILTSSANGNSVESKFNFSPASGEITGSNHFNYSENNAEQLRSVALNSETWFTTNNTNHAAWTMAQSGFQASFDLEANEIFSFEFDLFNTLEISNSVSNNQDLAVKQTHVLYFYAQPKAINFDHAILMFPLHPNLSISANDDRLDLGLFAITNSLTGNQAQTNISSNGYPQDSAYFQIDSATQTQTNLNGKFEYMVDQSTRITVVGYTNSDAVAIETSVPEPSATIPLLGIGIIAAALKVSKN